MADVAGGSQRVGGIHYDVELNTQKMLDGQRDVERSIGAVVSKLNIITNAVKVYAAALTLLKASEAADNQRLLAARVQVATKSLEESASVMSELRRISTDTQSAISDNVTVFTRLNASILQMGGTTADTLKVTELLSKAITVSGASAAEKSSAMIQFGQALGSGKLAGDELRSLLENAPYLMRQLADGLGVPIGALKKLGEEGKLTSDVVLKSLGKAANQINADFAKFPKTVGGAVTVATDAFKRLLGVMDELGQSNELLAGIITGVGKVFGFVADELRTLTGAADNVARNNAIKSWADSTVTVLTYVVDAVDFVTRGFRQMGTLLGGLAASAGAAATGEFKQARDILGQMGSDLSRIGSGPLTGQRIRDRVAQAAIEDRGFTPAGTPSNLKGTPDKDAQAKAAAKRAAAQAYLEGLLADTKIGLAKVDAEEQKALAENTKRLQSDRANADIYAKAKAEIVAKYARERLIVEETTAQEIAAVNIALTTDEVTRIQAIRSEAVRSAEAQARIGLITFEQAERAKAVAAFQAAQALADIDERNDRARAEAAVAVTLDESSRIAQIRDEAIRQAEEGYRRGKLTFEEAEAAKTRAVQQAIEQQRALEASRASARTDTLSSRAARTGGADDQVALIQAQAEQALAANELARQKDLAAAQVYADRKVEIERDAAARIADVRAAADQLALTSASDAAGALVGVLKNSAGEQSGVYRVMFEAQKAFAVASSLVAIQSALAKATDAPYPQNIVQYGIVAAQVAGIISTIQGTNYGGGRQYGGPTSAGKMYRVNETGRPEMFTAANGSQYMLPTANGRVTAANAVGGGGGQVNNVFNYGNDRVRTQKNSSGGIDVFINQVEQQLGERIGNGVGLAQPMSQRFGLNSASGLMR